MHADDAKIYLEIREKQDQEILQKDLDSLKTWSDQWLLKFQPKKVLYHYNWEKGG